MTPHQWDDLLYLAMLVAAFLVLVVSVVRTVVSW